MEIVVRSQGQLQWNARRVRCALGRAGISLRGDKREGDGTTPSGIFPLRRALYRADRLARPATGLPIRALRSDDAWSDDPADPLYNRPVSRPHPFSHEALWRADPLYDVVVVIGHNDDPPLPGAGSAIFMHVAAAGYAPTEGCIALTRADLVALLADCRPGDILTILPPN